jgi:hypothetical protein
MKTKHEDHSRLLNDLLPPKEITRRLEIENVLRSIENAHAKQLFHVHRARILLVAGVVFLMCSWWVHSRHAFERRAASVSASRGGEADTPTIKTVDDEGLLRMMNDGPAALAEWPDGRQSLLILVTHSAVADSEPEIGRNPVASSTRPDDVGAELNGSND